MVSVKLLVVVVLLFACSVGPGDLPVLVDCTTTSAPAGLSATQVLARVRKVIGYDALRKHSDGIVVEGVMRYLEGETKHRFMFTPTGEILEQFDGVFSGKGGFDESRAWMIDASGMPYACEPSLNEYEDALLSGWLRSGYWMEKDANILVSVLHDQTNDKQVVVSVKLKGGDTERWVVIDRSTWLPSAICEPDACENPLRRLEDYRRVMGFRFPHRSVLNEEHGLSGVIEEVRSVRKAPASVRNPYTPITKVPNDTRFSRDSPPNVELKRARSGHMLVRPRIDGQDVGWFVLDSGASFTAINSKTADSVDMSVLGRFSLGEADADVTAGIRRGRRFELGPMVMLRPHYFATDLSPLSGWLRTDNIVGICGYDVFRRSVVELDVANESLSIHDPENYPFEEITWQPFLYYARMPIVRCKFEGDREALFLIDTGADSELQFFAPAVKAFNLRDKAKKSAAIDVQIPGTIFKSTSSDKGTLAWFEIGGHRIENIEDVELTKDDGKPYSGRAPAGLVGLGLLRHFKVIFDYPHKRIAFVKLDDKQPTSSPTTGKAEGAPEIHEADDDAGATSLLPPPRPSRRPTTP